MSEQPKFTPGPWKIRNGFDGESYEVYPAKVNGESKPNIGVWAELATVNKHPQPGSTGKANARLIAAAPDMYEALEALQKANGANDFNGWHDSFAPAIEKARAALTKARGQQ